MRILIFVLLTACLHLPHVDPEPRILVTQQRAAVEVEVLCHDVLSEITWSHGFATGFIISDRHVITAAHVTTCPAIPSAWVTLSNGRRLRMAVEREDLDADVARLVIASADRFWHAVKPPMILMNPDVGAEVCIEAVVPYKVRTCGIMTAPYRVNGGAIDGNSGSAAYLDGRLIGLVSGNSGGRIRISPIGPSWLSGT